MKKEEKKNEKDSLQRGKQSRKQNENLKLFKKGTSGNPKGRPKGKKNYTTLMHEACIEIAEEKGWLDENEKPDFNRVMRTIMKRQLVNSVDGDIKHMSDLYDRMYGKPTVPIKADIKIVSDEEAKIAFDELEAMMKRFEKVAEED